MESVKMRGYTIFGRKYSTMKCIRFLPLVFFFFLSTLVHGQIDFREGSWNDIIEMAKTENKPIFLDSYPFRCGQCKIMEGQVFPQPYVGYLLYDNIIISMIHMVKG